MFTPKQNEGAISSSLASNPNKLLYPLSRQLKEYIMLYRFRYGMMNVPSKHHRIIVSSWPASKQTILFDLLDLLFFKWPYIPLKM